MQRYSLGSDFNRRDWQENQIQSTSRREWLPLVVFTCVWCVALGGMIMQSYQDWVQQLPDRPAIFLLLIFPAVTLILIVHCIRTTLHHFRFGDQTLTLDPFPAYVGRKVGGMITLKRGDPNDQIASFTLSCFEISRNETNEGEGEQRSLLWQESSTVSPIPSADGMLLRFRFAVPDHLPGTDTHFDRKAQADAHIEWQVDLHVPRRGFDISRRFTIPVLNPILRR